MGLPALVEATAPYPIDQEVAEALALCKGDALTALRITLIANAFLEARIDELETKVSAGYARRRRKAKDS